VATTFRAHVSVHVRCRTRVLNTDDLNFMTGAAWCHGPGRAIPGGDGSPGDCGVPCVAGVAMLRVSPGQAAMRSKSQRAGA